MKISTKDVILIEARKLFNQHGYNGVSMKDIADAVGISKGNLTYHFNKKENIMEALVAGQNKAVEMLIPENLKELDDTFRHIQEMVTDNSFYFMHHAQLSQVSPEISGKQNAVYKASIDRFKKAFVNMQQLGLLRDELIEGEFDTIIDTLHMGSIYWESFSRIHDSQTDYRSYAWNLMYSLLTEKGQDQLKKLEK